MPVFSSQNMQVFIQSASGRSLRLGPGPGDASWPDVAENGQDVAVIKDAGKMLGRIYTEDMEGEISVSLHHMERDIDTDELWDAILHRGTWASEATCDPGGTVWAPSILVKGERGGKMFALRWASARIKASGAIALSGSTLAFTASVVGGPIVGADAITWPT